VGLVGYLKKKSITMHGNMNVIYVTQTSHKHTAIKYTNKVNTGGISLLQIKYTIVYIT